MKQLIFSFEVSRCSACMACVVACEDQNDLCSEIAFRQVTNYESGEHSSVKITSLSISCFQCGDAPCLMVCPTGAIFRREDSGIIDIEHDLCVGCQTCLLTCPFGAPKFTQDGKMAKCDMCHARIAVDMKPACVKTCPTGALEIGTSAELSKAKAEKASLVILKSQVTE